MYYYIKRSVYQGVRISGYHVVKKSWYQDIRSAPIPSYQVLAVILKHLWLSAQGELSCAKSTWSQGGRVMDREEPAVWDHLATYMVSCLVTLGYLHGQLFANTWLLTWPAVW